MSTPTDDGDELLRRVLTGDVAEDSPEVRAALRSDPELAAQLAGLQGLESRLRTIGRDRAEVLAEAEDLAHAPGEEHVGPVLMREHAARKGGRRTSFAPLYWAAAALLLCVAIGARALLGDGPAGAGDGSAQWLGAEESGNLSPAGPGADYSAFTWTSERGATWGVQVEVFAAEDGVRGKHLCTSRRLEGTTKWSPEPQEHAGWPDTIFWRLSWFAPGSTVPVPGAEAFASRRAD